MSSYNLTPNICYSVIQMINQTNKMNVIIQFYTKYLLLCHLNDQSNKQNECHHTIWHQISVTLSFKWSIKLTKWMSSYNFTPNICYSVIQMINQTNKMNVIIQFDTKYLLLCHLNDQSNKQNECHHTILHQISVTLSFKWSIKQTKWMSSYNFTPNICYSVI